MGMVDGCVVVLKSGNAGGTLTFNLLTVCAWLPDWSTPNDRSLVNGVGTID